MSLRQIIIVVSAVVGGLAAFAAGQLFWVQRQFNAADEVWAEWATDDYLTPAGAIVGALIAAVVTYRRR